MVIQRQAIAAVDKRIEEREAKRPQTGVVKKKRASSVDLRVKGSAQLWKNVPVVGDISQVNIEDTVILRWEGRRPSALAPGVSSPTLPKRDATILARTVYVEDSADYFSGETVEGALSELGARLGTVVGPEGVVAPHDLNWNWSGPNLELWWSHSGEGIAVQDYRVRVYTAYGGTLYKTDYVMTTRYAWTLGDHHVHATGELGPYVFVDVAARGYDGTFSSTISATCENLPPLDAQWATYVFSGPSLTIHSEWPDERDAPFLLAEFVSSPRPLAVLDASWVWEGLWNKFYADRSQEWAGFVGTLQWTGGTETGYLEFETLWVTSERKGLCIEFGIWLKPNGKLGMYLVCYVAGEYKDVFHIELPAAVRYHKFRIRVQAREVDRSEGTQMIHYQVWNETADQEVRPWASWKVGLTDARLNDLSTTLEYWSPKFSTHVMGRAELDYLGYRHPTQPDVQISCPFARHVTGPHPSSIHTGLKRIVAWNFTLRIPGVPYEHWGTWVSELYYTLK